MAKSNMTEDQIKELREAFAMIDRNGDGIVGHKELGDVLRGLGVCSTEAELYDLINQVDLDGSGEIDFMEFAQFMTQRMAHEVTDEKLIGVFKVFDRDGDGFISFNEFRTTIINLGEKITDEEFDDMIRELDSDGDGHISYDEFMGVMRSG